MNSTSVDNLNTLTTSTKASTKNRRLARAHPFVLKSTHLDSFQADGNQFLSHSQTSFHSFHFAPETIEQITQPPATAQRRARVQWVQRYPSVRPADILTNSSIDFNDSSTNDSFAHPSISITEMTTEDFTDEYGDFIEPVTPTEGEETMITVLPIRAFSSDDDDDDDDDRHATLLEGEEPEQLANGNTTTDSAAPVGSKPKKKSKTDHPKKIQSGRKRNKSNRVTLQPSSVSSSAHGPTPSSDGTGLPPSPMKTPVPSVVKTEETSGGKPLITVDTSRARSNIEVVRLCLRELGWKECPSGNYPETDIYWHSSSFHENHGNVPLTSGRVNKFPCMSDLLRKIHLTRSLNHMRLLFPNEYNFYPKTWFLPEQNQQFKDDVRYIHQQDKKHHRSLTTFIVKPSDGSQGEGIYLLRDPSHIITSNRPHVIQEYIDRPLLMNGLKFDLRIYVLILNLYPLEILLYDEGLARFATVNYKAPSTENLHQTYMHLTNYSLNKRSVNYKHSVNDQQLDGSKRKLSVVWQQLSELFGPTKIERTKVLIVEMINKTLLAIVPELRVEYEFELPLAKRQNLSCFQIVGFDIILDEQLKPILLEVNSNPSLRIDFDKPNELGKLVYQSSPIDEEIKKPLVLETLKLALPKKKLDTIARHVQSLANDEIMAQRLEKVAQRRVEERSEKIKSARSSRFDIRLNPFFSRPLNSAAKEVERQHQELEKSRHRASPGHPTVLLRLDGNFSSPLDYRRTPIISNEGPTESVNKATKKSKKAQYFVNKDDDESGPTHRSPSSPQRANHRSAASQRSSSNRHSAATTHSMASTNQSISTTDISMIASIKTLKLIFSSTHKNPYQHLLLVDQIAYIYIQIVVLLGQKTMTGGQFRSFASVCGIISETITAPSIDILYYQILRKWQQFFLRAGSSGLPYSAFVEAFFCLSQRKFPHAASLLDSVDQLIQHCTRHLNSNLSTAVTPSLYQSNQYILQRTARNSSLANSATFNARPTLSALRPPTTVSPSRSMLEPSSAVGSRNRLSQQSKTSSATTMLSTSSHPKGKQGSMRQSAKSVFPLFFDVL